MTNNSGSSSMSSSKSSAPRPASAISINTSSHTPTRQKTSVRTPTGALKRALPSSLQRADSGEPAPVARIAPLRSALSLKHRSESSPSRLGAGMEDSDRESTPTASGGSAAASRMAPDSPRASMKLATGYRKGMYVAFVSNVFQERSRGNEAPYYELISQFRTPNTPSGSVNTGPTAQTLQSWLGALSHVVSTLDRRSHAELVEPILSLPWTTLGGFGSAGETFARAWIRFVCALVSARVEWMGEVLKRAVKGLSYRSDWRSQSLSTSTPQPSRRLQYSYVHLLLRSLLELVPTLPAQLAPLLIKYFPHKREGRAAHIVYVRNALDVCSYAGELAETVLLCVVDRAMQIDVEIQIELDELDDEAEGMPAGPALEDPFDSAVDGLSESESDSESDDDLLDSAGGLGDLSDDDSNDGAARNGRELSESETAKRLQAVRELVAKLDAIMAVVLKHLEAQNRKYLDIANGLTSAAPVPTKSEGSANVTPASLDTTPARALALRGNQFQMLLGVFARSILPTFKSRHVQFLMFYHASLDGDFADVLLGFLISKAIYGIASPADAAHTAAPGGVEGGEPVIMRVAAASYVASLVSRAKYISTKDCRAVMLNLCAFLEAHLEMQSLNPAAAAAAQAASTSTSAINGPHAVFYAVTQAAFYIFCFRWRDLRIDLDDAHADEGLASSFTSSVDLHGVSPGPTPPPRAVPSMSAHGAKWSEGLGVLQRAITSALNPLAHCSPTVVRQFAGVAQHTGLLYCWSIIESNRRGGAALRNQASLARLNVEGPNGTPSSAQPPSHNMAELQRDAPLAHPINAQASQVLDVFFPFDPYRLKLSARWIEPLYREWGDVAPEGMRGESSEDENDSSDEEEEEEEVGSDASPTRTGMRIPGAVSEVGSPAFDADAAVSRSLEAMSLSM